MRKLSAWLIAAALVLSLLPATFATDDTVITVHPPGDGVKAGDTFTVTVDISGNPGLRAIQFSLAFDHDLMDCTKVSMGSIFDGTYGGSNPNGEDGALVFAASSGMMNGDCTLATYQFRAKMDISSYDFSILEVTLKDQNRENVVYSTVMETSGTATAIPTTSATGTKSAETQPTQPQKPEETTKPTESMPNPGTEPTKVTESPTPDETQQPTQTPTTPEATTIPTTQPVSPARTEETTPQIAFSDTAGHWAENWIYLAMVRGIFKGNPDGTFKPNAPISRGDYVLTLYRMAGEPALGAGANPAPFPDVPETAYYAKAIAWAYANGLVSGKGNGFDPKAPVTRQEAMKILFAFSGSESGMELMLGSVYDQSFADSGEIASWAKPAMYWAVYKGIINGMDGGLAPKGQTTRAQLAKILVEYQNRLEREAAQAARNP